MLFGKISAIFKDFWKQKFWKLDVASFELLQSSIFHKQAACIYLTCLTKSAYILSIRIFVRLLVSWPYFWDKPFENTFWSIQIPGEKVCLCQCQFFDNLHAEFDMNQEIAISGKCDKSIIQRKQLFQIANVWPSQQALCLHGVRFISIHDHSNFYLLQYLTDNVLYDQLVLPGVCLIRVLKTEQPKPHHLASIYSIFIVSMAKDNKSLQQNLCTKLSYQKFSWCLFKKLNNLSDPRILKHNYNIQVSQMVIFIVFRAFLCWKQYVTDTVSLCVNVWCKLANELRAS